MTCTPSGGGANCSGSSTGTSSCNTQACPGTVTGSASYAYPVAPDPCAGSCGPGPTVWDPSLGRFRSCPNTWSKSGSANSSGCSGGSSMVVTDSRAGGPICSKLNLNLHK